MEQPLTPDQTITPTKAKTQRRYDVDWLRTLALGLLIIYHSVITFQPWASYIYFIQNKQSIEWLWTAMSFINVWRIPILFIISGMGVRFAMERRNWKQLLRDRTFRILVPFIFGFFFISPILVLPLAQFYHFDPVYVPSSGHLWFLANIYIYVLLLLPVIIYLKKYPDNIVLRALSGIFRYPVTLLLMALPLMIEAVLVITTKDEFVIYAVTWHGFWIGMICFITGFIFVSVGDVFWQSVSKIRWLTAILAVSLAIARISEMTPDTILFAAMGFESMMWMLAILGFGAVYLNKSSQALSYLNQAVYPVYILHLPIQFILSYYIVPLELAAEIKLIILLVGTLGLSLFLYEIINRIKWIRPLFGIKFSTTKQKHAPAGEPISSPS